MKVSAFIWLAGIFLSAVGEGRAQLAAPFEALDISGLVTGFFADQSPGWMKLSDYDGSESPLLSPGQGKQLYLELLEAAYEDHSLPSLSELRQMCRETLQNSGAIPVVVLDFSVQRLAPWALDSGWVALVNGNYVKTLPEADIFESVDFFAAFTFHDEIPVLGGKICHSEVFRFSNREGPASWFINLNDGIGEIPMEGEFITTTPGLNTDLSLEVICERAGQFLKAGVFLPGRNCSYDIQPDPAPWPTDNDPAFPWRISAEYNGETVRGNAYIKYSGEDYVLDKPFVFVEGIDFNTMDAYPDRYGDFGWCQFITGADEQYDFLYNMPSFIAELRNRGYDIILVDFEDGADYVQKNSALLQSVIYKINDAKEGREPNILSGASMGGQITRHALTWMEEHNMEHCSRLWISMDSPHTGANIPIGLQETLVALAEDGSAEAGQMLEETLDRPAARQFLQAQYNPNASLFSEWYGELNSLGFPEEPRNIGIANGSMTGVANPLLPSQSMIDYEVGILGEELSWIKAYATPGAYAGEQFGFITHSSRFPDGVMQLPDWLGGLCIPYSYNEYVFAREPENAIPLYDSAPGGTRPTARQLVEAMNAVLEANSCNPPLIENYQPVHSFISTQSALGIYWENPFSSVEYLMWSVPDICPFDAVFGPDAVNERHSELSAGAMQVVLNEILSGENELPEVLDSGLRYNFSNPLNTWIREVEVLEDAEILLNAQEEGGFGGGPWPLPGSHVDFRVSGCGTVVTFRSGSELHIGSESGLSTASLFIPKGATVIVEEGAEIYIHPGSTLTIGPYGNLQLRGGDILMDASSRLDIMEDAFVQVEGESSIESDEEQTEIGLNGLVELSDGASLKILVSGLENAMHWQEPSRITGSGQSKITIIGSNLSSANIEVSGSVLADLPSGVFFSRWCDWQMQEGAELVSRARTTLMNCSLSGLGGETFEVFGHCRLEKSSFHQLEMRLSYQENATWQMKARECGFSGEAGSGIRQYGGTFSVQSCSFSDFANVVSEDLHQVSSIHGSVFEGNGPGSPMAIYVMQHVGVQDAGSSRIDMSDNEFTGYRGSAVFKSGGEIRLRCNDFGSCHTALMLTDGASGKLGESTGTGYNSFSSNRFHVRLQSAQELNVYKGFNKFRGFYDKYFQGNLLGTCACNSSDIIDARSNSWYENNSIYPPLSQHFNVWRAADCPGDPLQVSCNIPVVDVFPANASCNTPGLYVHGKTVKEETKSGVRVYPNPLSANSVVESENEITQWKVLDGSGRVLSSGVFEIPVRRFWFGEGNSLPGGLFILTVTEVDGREVYTRFAVGN